MGVFVLSVLIGVVPFFWYLAKTRRTKNHIKNLLKSRPNRSFEEFRSDYPGVPEEKLEATFYRIQEILGRAGDEPVALYPDDRLIETLKLEPREASEIVNLLAEFSGLTYTERSRFLAKHRDPSVSELVSFINSI